jgi:hypothetical protein
LHLSFPYDQTALPCWCLGFPTSGDLKDRWKQKVRSRLVFWGKPIQIQMQIGRPRLGAAAEPNIDVRTMSSLAASVIPNIAGPSQALANRKATATKGE